MGDVSCETVKLLADDLEGVVEPVLAVLGRRGALCCGAGGLEVLVLGVAASREAGSGTILGAAGDLRCRWRRTWLHVGQRRTLLGAGAAVRRRCRTGRGRGEGGDECGAEEGRLSGRRGRKPSAGWRRLALSTRAKSAGTLAL